MGRHPKNVILQGYVTFLTFYTLSTSLTNEILQPNAALFHATHTTLACTPVNLGQHNCILYIFYKNAIEPGDIFAAPIPFSTAERKHLSYK